MDTVKTYGWDTNASNGTMATHVTVPGHTTGSSMTKENLFAVSKHIIKRFDKKKFWSKFVRKCL